MTNKKLSSDNISEVTKPLQSEMYNKAGNFQDN